MLVGTKEIITRAYKDHYAVVSPSIDGPECLWMSVRAAEEMKSPVILGMRHGVFATEELRTFVDFARRLATEASVPVSINWDHSPTMEIAFEGFYAGVTSVMLDYSTKSFEENIAGTKEVCEAAHRVGISVEAELGHLGVDVPLEGTDKGIFAVSENIYTDPKEAGEFVRRTGVDCLAVSIGNKHGIYANDIIPHINFEILEAINKECGIPLVMHGGSGTGDENLHKAGTMGVCKINVGSDLRKEAADAVINCEDRNRQRTRGFFLMHDGYKECVKHQMEVFGCAGKAW